jgi:azurin
MTPVGMNKATQAYAVQAKNAPAAPQPATAETKEADKALKVEQNKVTLSAEGKALLSALSEIDKESKEVANKNKDFSDKVESFTHGALGMSSPDKIEESEDSSYSAGQYVSGALTAGALLLAII